LIKLAKPFEVTESVTIVVWGCSSNIIVDIRAIRAFLFIGLPLGPTIAALSTSVSNIIPKSPLLSSVAWQILAIASLFSGFGIWLGNIPSGFKNWLPSVSAPSLANTLSAKNPPAPLPASTIIFIPARGFS